MTFAYLGAVERRGSLLFERSPASVVGALRNPSSGTPSKTSAALASPPSEVVGRAGAGCAELRIEVRVEGDELAYETAEDSVALDGSASRESTARALAAAARVAAELEVEGRVHGDLRPDTVRLSSQGPRVIVPPAVAPGELLRARIAAGALLSDVGYVAPEVLRGETATLASDTYSIAALAYASLTGFPPIGVVDERVLHPFGRELAPLVHRALASDPRIRPPIDYLTRGLSSFADGLARNRELAALSEGGATSPPFEVTTAGPRPLPPRAAHLADPAPRLARMEEERNASSTLLTLILILGGACVFLGVLALAVTRWSTVGTSGQLGLLGLFTLATVGTGLGLSRRGFERSGFTLELVGLELFWAVAYHALATRGLASSLEAWTVASGLIGASHCMFAAWRRSTTVAASSALAFSITAASFGVDVAENAPRTAILYAGVIGALYAGVALLASRAERPSLARPFALGSFLWTSGSAIAVVALLADRTMGTPVIEILWPYLLMGGAALATGFAVPAWKWSARRVGAVALALLPTVQALLLGGAEAPIVTVTLVMVVLGLGASLVASRGLREEDRNVSALGALTAAGWVALGAGRAVVDFAESGEPGSAAWPFLVAFVSFGCALVVTRLGGPSAVMARRVFVTAGALLLLFIPSVEIVAAQWGDAPLAYRGVLVVVVSHLFTLAVARTEKLIGRSWIAPFAAMSAFWTLSTSVGALREIHRGSAVAALWPFAAALAAIGLGRLLREDEVTEPDGSTVRVTSRGEAIVAMGAAAVLLGAPSLEVVVANPMVEVWWASGTLAIAGTALSGLVAHVLVERRLSKKQTPALGTLTTLFGVTCLAWVLQTLRLSFREVASGSDYLSSAVAWPYLVAGATFGAARFVKSSRPSLAFAARTVGLALATLSAAYMAFVASDRIGFVVFAALLGHAVLFSAARRLHADALPTEHEVRGLGLWLGAGCAVLAPAALCLTRCFGHDGEGLSHAVDGARPVGYFTLFLVDLALLFAVTPSQPHLPRPAARGLELLASATFFGVIGLLALPRLATDYLFMTTFFVGGAGILLLGLARRRVVLVTFSAVALLVGLFVEYFAKLYREVHWGVLALGFGAALLGCALLFERKVKPLLPSLSRWS